MLYHHLDTHATSQHHHYMVHVSHCLNTTMSATHSARCLLARFTLRRVTHSILRDRVHVRVHLVQTFYNENVEENHQSVFKFSKYDKKKRRKI